MHQGLEKEIATYEKRTPKSTAAHKRAPQRIPLGVASNYRAYDPYPIFVKDGRGSQFRDLDGNEYIDSQPLLRRADGRALPSRSDEGRREKLTTGTMFGMPHDMEWELAEEICNRFPVEMVRFGNSGTEATMHAIRLARAATGRDKIMKFEGAYHGLHDSALGQREAARAATTATPMRQRRFPAALGFRKRHSANVLIAHLQRSGQRRASLQARIPARLPRSFSSRS